jgi:hypothetical protein
MHQPDPLSLRPGDLAIGGRSPHLLPADGEKFLSPRGERGEVACVELISKGSRRVPLARATNPPGKCSPDCSQAPGLFLARVPANVSRISAMEAGWADHRPGLPSKEPARAP